MEDLEYETPNCQYQEQLLEILFDKYSLRTSLLAMLVGATRELCYEIEKISPSEQQTRVSILASDISREIESIVQNKKGNESILPMSETMVAYRNARTSLEIN